MRYIVPETLSLNKYNWLGEDEFFNKALDGTRPYIDIAQTFAASAELPDGHFPATLNMRIQSLVSMIKTEAHFNPKRVGSDVIVGVIDRERQHVSIFAF